MEIIKYYFASILVFLNFVVYAQEFPIDIKNTKVEKYISFEKNEGSNISFPISNNQTNVGKLNTIKFTRNDLSNNDYEAIYIYDKVDSTTVATQNSWSIKEQNSTISEKNIMLGTLIREKFDYFKKLIEDKFGKGIDDTVEESLITGYADHGRIQKPFSKTYLWEVDNQTSIILDIYISALFEKGDYSKHSSYYKLRLDLINDKNIERKLPQEKLNDNAINFFETLKNNDVDELEKYISPRIPEYKKNEFFENIKTTVGPNFKLKLIENSYETTAFSAIRGSILRYKYLKPKNRDKNLKITFDRTGRIISIYNVNSKE